MAFKMKGWSAFTKGPQGGGSLAEDGSVQKNKSVKKNKPVVTQGTKKSDVYGPHNKIVGEQGKLKKEVKKVNRPKPKPVPGKKVLKEVGKAIVNPAGYAAEKVKKYYDKNIKGTTREVIVRDKDGNVIKSKKKQR